MSSSFQHHLYNKCPIGDCPASTPTSIGSGAHPLNFWKLHFSLSFVAVAFVFKAVSLRLVSIAPNPISSIPLQQAGLLSHRKPT